MSYIVSIRDRRQMTVPREVLEELSLSVGDRLVLEIREKKMIAKPVKTQSLDTLRAIKRVFQEAELTEDEFQKSGQKVRKELGQKLYG